MPFTVVHAPLLACLSQTGLALALISFNFFSIICYIDEDLENIVTVWARKPKRITV